MMIVQYIPTSEFAVIQDNEFNPQLHVNRNNIWHWGNTALSLGVEKSQIKDRLIELSDAQGFANLRIEEQIIVANWFATEQSNIDAILTESQQIEIIMSAYQATRNEGTHESNGQNYFNGFRSKMVYDFRHGTRTDIEIFNIEQKLQEVTNKLITGDWMSAKALLSQITPDTNVTIEMIDSLLADFTNYINTSC